MNDIFDMAKQAHLGVTLTHDGELGQFIEGANWTEELVAFAKLVAAKERDDCANIINSLYDSGPENGCCPTYWNEGLERAEKLIKARSE